MGPSRPQSSEALVRKGHLTGLKPVVLVIFQSPVNFNRWKLEQLQIQMEAAPFRSRGGPAGCLEGWGTSGGLGGGHDLEGEAGVIRGVHDLVEMWGLLGILSEVGDLEEGMGRRLQQVSWPRWGYTEAPVGFKV